jgi:hypothetical protein
MTHDPDRHDPLNFDPSDRPDQLSQPDHGDPTPAAPPGDAAPPGAFPRRSGLAGPVQYMTAELWIGARRIYIRGRILGIVLWLITHQDRVNVRTANAGQLWLTWKDGDPLAVEGEIKTKL